MSRCALYFRLKQRGKRQMKKRILALALVIVTLVLTLTGCAYRYDKKDLSKLATVDATAFEAFLKEIEIEGHDFGAFVKGDNARDDKVLAEIDGILAEKETTDVSTGNYGIRQKITYAFYCTYVVEEEGKAPVTHIFNTSTMASKSTKNFLSIPVYENGTATNALESDDALTKAIFNAIKDKDVKTYKYETKTEDATEIAEGALVFATYKYTYMAGEEKKTVEVKCAPLTASKAEAATKIEDLLGGKKISDIKAATDLKFTDATLGECTVESLSIDFVVSGGQEVKVDFEIEAEMNVKDIANVSVKIPEDAKVTYHVYPVNAKAIPEQTAQNVVRLLYLTAGSESITTETLSCFGDLGMKELIEDFLSLKKTYETTKAATGEEGAKAAKEAYEAARKALPDKLVNVKSGADEVIMYDYKASVYDDLEAEYDEAIRSQLTAAIWAWAEENITVDDANLPKSAIKEAKKRIIAGHKYTYHTAKYSPSGDSKGASADDAIVYADGKDYPTLDAYLTLVAYKDKDANAEIEATAKAEVVELIRLYTLAGLYKGEIEKVRNSDITVYVDRLSAQMQYMYMQFGLTPPASTGAKAIRETYGDTALRAALTMDNLLNYLLETQVIDDLGNVLPEDASDAQKNAGHVQYVKVAFTLK